MMNMGLIKMSSRGQIVIPSAMRGDLDKGEEFIIIRDDERFVLKKIKQVSEQMKEDMEFAKRTEEAWQDIEAGNGKRYSVEEFFEHLEDVS
ncbi:MAG: AbrB/MazE/SpoVT family DNA-binding domain-containing protein [Desulfobacterales bacterium]|nr:AbrB/MazE/SpoVT family DNA-binding domain-containing protein [Desulfobacterales bacterium]